MHQQAAKSFWGRFMTTFTEDYSSLNPRLQNLVDRMPNGQNRVKLLRWLVESEYNSGTMTIRFKHLYPIQSGLVKIWLHDCPGLFDGFTLEA